MTPRLASLGALVIAIVMTTIAVPPARAAQSRTLSQHQGNTPHVIGAKHDPVTWVKCVYHLDAKTMTRIVRRQCFTYVMSRVQTKPAEYWTQRRYVSPHIRYWVKYPLFRRLATAPSPVAVPSSRGSYRDTWEVTYYVLNGVMADGNYVHPGAAACGYDVALGTRVFVPGVGIVVCEDRIGSTGNPWRHVDVWGDSNLGNDYRVVTVYP